MKTLLFIVVVAFFSGIALEKESKEFQFGMKTRYVEQCLTPLQAFGASIALVSEGIDLYDIKKEDLFYGTTKEQDEKIHLLTEAGYYWVYLNSCDSLKNTRPVEDFILLINKK